MPNATLKKSLDISGDNSQAGERVGREIIKQLRLLENFPRLGRVVPEFREENLRETIYSSYRLIYEVNDFSKGIQVVRIWHGARGTLELRSS